MKLHLSLQIAATFLIVSGFAALTGTSQANGVIIQGNGVCEIPGGCDGNVQGYDGIPWMDDPTQGNPCERRMYALQYDCRWTPGDATQRCAERMLVCFWQTFYDRPCSEVTGSTLPVNEATHLKQACGNGSPL